MTMFDMLKCGGGLKDADCGTSRSLEILGRGVAHLRNALEVLSGDRATKRVLRPRQALARIESVQTGPLAIGPRPKSCARYLY